MQKFLWIFLGGGTGSLLRYLASLYLTPLLGTSFPFATFAVNILGSFFLGIFIALAGERIAVLSEHWRLLLAVGFCGGFTTFSTFSLELFTMVQEGELRLAVFYIIISIFLGILSVFAGLGIIYWLYKIQFFK